MGSVFLCRGARQDQGASAARTDLAPYLIRNAFLLSAIITVQTPIEELDSFSSKIYLLYCGGDNS